MRIILLFILLSTTSSVLAVPGLDNLQALKQYYVLVKQLKELKKQVSQGDKFIQQEKQALQDAEGHYGYGQLFDSDSDFEERQWAPDTWNEALKNLSGGNSSRYQELLKTYDKSHPHLSENEFSRGASNSLTNSYENLSDNNRAATASADFEYDEIKTHLQQVHQLAEKIEQAPNTKAAMDLNSRLVAELSYISVEELRMQTLMNHQLAAQISDDLDDQKREAMFNQLPHEESYGSNH